MPSNPTRERGQRRAFGYSLLHNCIGACRGFCIWLVPFDQICTSQITRCTLRCPRGSTALVHLTTSPPHHLTTSPPHLTSRRRKKHANPPTTRCQLLLPGTEAYSVHVFQDLARDVITISSCTSQIPRCTLRCPHGSTSLVPGSSSVCEFVLVTDHNSLS